MNNFDFKLRTKTLFNSPPPKYHQLGNNALILKDKLHLTKTL